MTQPYRETAESLDRLVTELTAKRAEVEQAAWDMQDAASRDGTPLNKERYNILIDQAEGYWRKAEIVEVASNICYSMGTAAETVGI